MRSAFVVGILCLAGASFASECLEPWNSLEHTFNVLNAAKRLVKAGTDTIPRNITVPEGATCVNNVGKATYYGIRQQVKGDANSNIIGLYDKNGFIAGLQLRFNKSAAYAGWNNTFRYDRVPMFQIEETDQMTYFVLTAYFVEPSTICSEGRTSDDMKSANATGYTLLFQNGSTPSDLLVAPRRRPEAIQTGYSNNKCFLGMGNHTFYNVESYQASNCNEIVPVFLLHNSREDGCLVGFGLAFVGKIVAPHLEQPPTMAVESIIGKDRIPQCLVDLSKRDLVTTMHVFFTRRSVGCGGILGMGK